MKKLILICLLFVSTTVLAQVGINTTNPNAQLEIKSSDQVNPANNDGILIPKVDNFPAINPTIDQDGMLVYLTTDVGVNLKGFYYWDNTNSVWKSISSDKAWGLTGNAGTDVATNFIGTTDNMGLKFKVNNTQAGFIDPILYNTSFGQDSANSITTGIGNTAFGTQSLSNNTMGYYNAAVGFQSMINNTTGHDNSAFAPLALTLNTSGSRNTAIGMGSLNKNTIADDNTSVGYFSMLNNTIGLANVAIGANSMQSNTTGNYNTSVGYQSLFNSNGSYNAAIGYQSLYSNSSGIGNVAQGNRTMFFNVSGSNNTAIGNAAMYNSLGNKNSIVGNEALFNANNANANSALGDRALFLNTTGTGNIGIGQESNPTTTTGWNNIGIGFHSLGSINNSGIRITGNETGYDNVAIGLYAGDRSGINTNGCLFLGAFTNPTTNISLINATAIGRYATVNQDNSIVLGGINGINGATSNTKVGIGLTNPFSTLDVFNPETADIDMNVFSARKNGNIGSTWIMGSVEYYTEGWDNIGFSTKLSPLTGNGLSSLGSMLSTKYDGFRWGTLYTTTNPNVSSDITLKKNIKPLQYGLEVIRKINPISYIYKSEKLPNGEELSDTDKTKMLGFSAQELQDIIPEVVSNSAWKTVDEKTYYKVAAPTLGVRYGDLIPVVFNGIKQLDLDINIRFNEQQDEIEILKKQLIEEKNKNKNLEERLKAIEAKLNLK